MKIYLAEISLSVDEPSELLGAYSTPELAKAAAERYAAKQVLDWVVYDHGDGLPIWEAGAYVVFTTILDEPYE